MEGKPVSNLILDTGATRTLVRSDLLPPSIRMEGEVTIRCAHGDAVTYPLAVSTGSKEFLVRAGISNTLPVPVLLGRDIPELLSLINGTTDQNEEDAFLVTTRAQEKRQQETEQKLQEKEKESGAVAKPLEEQMVQTEPQCEPFDSLDESLFIPGRAKEKKTRSQKRQQRLEHARQADTHSLEITAADLQKLQGADPTLEAIRKIASGESGLAGTNFSNEMEYCIANTSPLEAKKNLIHWNN